MEDMSMLQITTFTVLWVVAFGGSAVGIVVGTYALMHVLDPIVDYATLALKTRLQKRARKNGWTF